MPAMGARSGSRTVVALAAALASAIGLASEAGAATPPEFAAAIAASRAGDALGCRDQFVRVAAAATQDGLARRALYGAAVCAVAGGDRDGAFSLLSGALAHGFHDRDRFYDDPRLAPLRADLRWPALESAFHDTVARWQGTLDPELARLYQEDRTDRSPGPNGVDAAELGPRDRARIDKAIEVMGDRRPRMPDDLFHLATVLSRSGDAEVLEQAYELARLAAERDADLDGARALAAAALDRSLVARGKPQRYGTQTVKVDGKWKLAELDPATTDADRAAWDVPPLAELRRRVETMDPAVDLPPAP